MPNEIQQVGTLFFREIDDEDLLGHVSPLKLQARLQSTTGGMLIKPRLMRYQPSSTRIWTTDWLPVTWDYLNLRDDISSVAS